MLTTVLFKRLHTKVNHNCYWEMMNDSWHKAVVIPPTFQPGLAKLKVTENVSRLDWWCFWEGYSRLLIISLKISPLFTNLFPRVCFVEFQRGRKSCFRQLLDVSLLQWFAQNKVIKRLLKKQIKDWSIIHIYKDKDMMPGRIFLTMIACISWAPL